MSIPTWSCYYLQLEKYSVEMSDAIYEEYSKLVAQNTADESTCFKSYIIVSTESIFYLYTFNNNHYVKAYLLFIYLFTVIYRTHFP